MSDSQKRTKTGQAKHDKKVLQRLNLYKEKHFSVKADLPGRVKPRLINGRIPDIIAKKGRKLIVEEIETPSTKVTDKIQHQRLKKGVKKLGGVFKVIIAK